MLNNFFKTHFICSTLIITLMFVSNDFIYAADFNTIPSISQQESKESYCQWYYKKIDGKLYRRLYDTSKRTWITDWLPVK